MKKLMIVSALLCVAVSAQALPWTFDIYNIKDPFGGAYTGDATLSCEALNFTQDITLESAGASGYWYAEGVEIANTDSNKDYDFVLTAQYTSGDDSYTGTANVNASGMSRVFMITKLNWEKNESSNPVPEPTSGLLLLLGMAGLALKRKRV